MKTINDINIIENNGKKFKFLFPNNFFYYSCKNCLINCCTRNDKILLHKKFKSEYGNYFKQNHKLFNFGVCPQLKNDGRCKIELEQGKYAKPDICNIFPYRILGQLEGVYIVSLNYYDCSITDIGDTSISINNFFEQTKNINFDFYNFIPRDDLSKYKGYYYNTSDLLSFFDENYNLKPKIIIEYWNIWNTWYSKNYKFPKFNYLIKGMENSFLINKNPYKLLTPLEKVSLLYLITLFEDISENKISSYNLLKLIKDFNNTIKILTLANEKLIFNKKLDLNSEFFIELVTVYHYNKKYSLNEALKKINVYEKGSFINELSRFI